MICSCALNMTERPRLLDMTKKIHQNLIALVNSRRYDTDDQFTVVVQPFMKDASPPLTPEGLADESFFAPDCFHFSAKGHALAAIGLWNNMVR
jgi:phospholipase B1